MSLTELKKTYEKRRHDLITLLENPNSGLDLSKQHQVYGAIKEIETLLKTIDSLQEAQTEEPTFELTNEQDSSMLDKISSLLRK
jgi:hypothetical protein